MFPEAEYFQPGDDISWLVRRFEVISYNSDKGIKDKFVPREDASIVFHFGNLPQILTPVVQMLPHFFIAPLCPTANSITISGQLDCLVASCKPTVLSRILGISIKAGSSLYIPLPKVFHQLWKEMKTGETPENRIKTISAFFKSLSPYKYVPDESDIIYDSILQKGINTPLSDIISEMEVSERTIQRRFRDRLGVSPKMLIRIMRINYLWDTISSGGRIDYQDLVFLGNYFDQTHLIKDFKSITSETPDSFFKRNLDVVKILSGK